MRCVACGSEPVTEQLERTAQGYHRRCQLGGRRTKLRLPLPFRHGQSGGSHAGHLAPGLEGTVPGGSMVVGGQEVAAELEQVVDLSVAGEEPLGLPR